MRKVACVLLVLVMLLGVLSFTACNKAETTNDDAANSSCTPVEFFTFELNNDSVYGNDSYMITGAAKELPADVVLPKSYNGLPITTIAQSAFVNNTNIQSLKISDTIVAIGLWAFEGCTSLKTVEVASSVKFIMAYAFRGCTALESVTFNEGLECIMTGVFRDCSSLKSLAFPQSTILICGANQYPINYITDHNLVIFGLNIENSERNGMIYASDIDDMTRDPDEGPDKGFSYGSIISGCSSLKSISLYAGTKVTTHSFYCAGNEPVVNVYE